MRLEGLEDATETAQGKAFFRWLRLFSRMSTGGMIQAYEGEHGKEQSVMDSHKQLFVYGWGFCDTSSRIAEAAWVEYKQDRDAAERVCLQHENGGYHTMYRLRLDGHYGAFDPRYGYYLVERDAPDARILDWDGIGVDANILKNKKYKHRSKPFFEYFGREWKRAFLINPAFYPSEGAWRKAGAPIECAFSNRMYRMGTPFHDMNFRLPKGTLIERHWDNSARKFYVPAGKHTEREEPFLPFGRVYRVTETMLDGNWVKYDPNYEKAKPYLVTVPKDERYKAEVAGGRTIGQAWGKLTYEPNLGESLPSDALTADSNLGHSTTAPFLRPQGTAGGQATLDLYSPYVLVDGTLSGELAGSVSDEVRIEIRTLGPKPRNRAQPDVWSDWDVVHSRPGKFAIALGRERFNGTDVSIHGVYRLQIRLSVGSNPVRSAPAGVSALKLDLYFENGIMSIPQIFAGSNTIDFKVEDASQIRGPLKVIYKYQTADGERSHEKVLRASDFRRNVANYQLEAPGLIRCNSLSVAY
jgi:hypothetical protein